MIKYLVFLISAILLFWGCEDDLEINTNPKPLPSFSVRLNISDNDEVRSVLHTMDGGYIILVSEVIEWPHYSATPIRGSSFLVKKDSLGVQEWVTELDNSLAEDLQLTISEVYSVEQDIDGSYIVWTGISTGYGLSSQYNCIRIDAEGNNQIISYENLHNLVTSNNESYSYLTESEIIWDPFEVVTHHSISKIGSAGDTLWTRDIIDFELLEIDSNFIFYGGEVGTRPQILSITDDNGFLFGNFGPLLSIAKFNSNGDIEWVTVDTYNDYGSIALLGYPYTHLQPTNDGGYIFYGRALLKINAQGEIEWLDANPNSMVERTLWSKLTQKQTTENNYFLFGSEPEPADFIEYLDWDLSVPFITEIDNFGNILSRKDYPQFRRTPVLNATPDGGYVFSTSYTADNGNVGLVLIKADSEGNILDLEN